MAYEEMLIHEKGRTTLDQALLHCQQAVEVCCFSDRISLGKLAVKLRIIRTLPRHQMFVRKMQYPAPRQARVQVLALQCW
jgi:hypothetical protein